MIAEYNGSNALQRRWVFDPTTDQPVIWFEGTGTAATDRRYLSADERGSIISVSESTGAALAIDSYDEYGQPGASNLGRLGYTGQAWLPEITLWYYRTRVYEPELGRFLQTDPIGYRDDPNLYAYVMSDPVNLLDPLGLERVLISPWCGTGCSFSGTQVTISGSASPPPGAVSFLPTSLYTGGLIGFEGDVRRGGHYGGARVAPQQPQSRRTPLKPRYCRSELYQIADDLDRLGRKAQYFAWAAFGAAKGEQYSYMRAIGSRSALTAYAYSGYARLFGSGLKVIAGDRPSLTDFLTEAVGKYAGVDALGQALGGTAMDFANDIVRPDPCH